MVFTQNAYINFQKVQDDIRQNRETYRKEFTQKVEAAKAAGKEYVTFGDSFDYSGNNELYTPVYDMKALREGAALMQGDYLGELQKRQTAYEEKVYIHGSYHDFTTDAACKVYAYSSLYQEIVKGYEDGTRKRYTVDEGKLREMTLEEELAKLDKDYQYFGGEHELLAITSQMAIQDGLQFSGQPYIAQQYDKQQVCGYVRNLYSELRERYLEQYGADSQCSFSDIKSMVRELLSSNKGMSDYCSKLVSQITYIA